MKNQIFNKKKLNKRMTLMITAATLTAAVVATGFFNCLQPIEAYARESFSGTKQIVQEHTDDPFVILDIVPSYATYTWSTDSENNDNTENDETTEEPEILEFSTGTLSAFVKGQAVMEQEYARVFAGKSDVLKKYDARKAFVDAVWVSGSQSDTWNVRYEEAFAGTRKELESAEDIAKKGWYLLIDKETLPLEDEDIGESASSGLMSGYYIKYEEPSTDSSDEGTSAETEEPDKTGYDYVKVGEWDDDEFQELTEAVYIYDDETGNYRLIFGMQDASEASDDNPISGYMMRNAIPITSQNASGYSDATGVYLWDEENQRYYYAGVLGDYRSLYGNGAEATTTPTSGTETEPTATPTSGTETEPTATPALETETEPTATPTSGTETVPTATPTSGTETEPTATPTSEAETEPTATPTTEPATEPTTEPTTEEQKVLGATRLRLVNREVNTVVNGISNFENTPGNETEDNEGNDTENNVVNNNTYYVLEFEYFANITDPGQVVYQIAQVEEIPEEAGEDERPTDAYALYSSGNAGIALFTLESLNTSEESKVFLYKGPGLGDYRLIDQADVSEDYRINNPPVTLEVRNAPTYFRFTAGCDWLKESVFHSLEHGDNANADFKLQIVHLRSDEVTMEWINQADLVYLENGDAPFLYTGDEESESHTVHHWLGKDKEVVIDKDSGKLIGITKENVYALVYRAVNEQLPVMLDASITENSKLSGSNYQALARIFLKEDLETYLQDAKTSPDWLLEHLEDDAYADKTDNGKHYVNRNIYAINSSTPLVNGDFKEAFSQESTSDGFEEVLDFIEAENVLSENQEEEQLLQIVSKARAIEYIINYAIGLVADYTDLKILELQPTANDKSDLFGKNADGGTTLFYKRSEIGAAEKQVLRSSSQIDVDVTVKSPAALNSEWTDLNSTYNLIFIGLDGQKLNHSSDLWDTVKYNDEELNGKLYHSGDLAAGLDERYDPVDITAGKKQALLDFMKAGYPILVENDFFKGKTAKNADESDINTKYVAKDTQMYQFLKEAVETDKYADKIYTIEDVHNNVMFRAQIATERPVLKLNEDVVPSNIQPSEIQETGVFRFEIPYKVSSLYGDDYGSDRTIECYLDINDDGGYSEEEKVSGLSKDTAQIWAVDEGEQMVVCFAQDPGSRAIPCRLLVCDNENPYLRSEVKGILRITSDKKEKVRILQIGNQDETSLAVLYEQENSVLSYYLKDAEGRMNKGFEITTMSMSNADGVSGQNLVTMLAENSDYLNRYDILVLGFGNGAEALSGEVAEAVNRYMEDGRSVLVSYKGACEESNHLSLSQELLGQMQDKTYVKLGRDSGNGLFRYEGMNAGMFTEISGLSAEGINDGSVYHYPYEIGKNSSFSGETRLKAGDYRLNLSNEMLPCVTPWFVLNGNSENAYTYNVSTHDGSNNYYLYSRGNVVYIGHQDYSEYTYQADSEENPIGTGLNECQMFVNALTLAYDAGIHNIKTDIVAGFEEMAAKIESISIPFDREIAEGIGGESGLLDDSVDVYFKYMDSNLAINKTYEVYFYYEDEAGSVKLDTGEKVVNVTSFTSELWTVEENVPVQVNTAQMKQGKVYRIKAPVEALKNNSSVTQAGIYVEVRCKLDRPGGEKTVHGCDNVSLNRVQLFMLE